VKIPSGINANNHKRSYLELIKPISIAQAAVLVSSCCRRTGSQKAQTFILCAAFFLISIGILRHFSKISSEKQIKYSLSHLKKTKQKQQQPNNQIVNICNNYYFLS